MDLLGTITYWHWLVLALLLVGIEMLIPGVFLLWIGLAAGAVALIVACFPTITIWGQGLLFAAASVISIFLARRIMDNALVEDKGLLNQRGQQYVGQVFMLSTAIVARRGKVRIGDTEWLASGPDLPQGSMVRIVAVEGITFKVEPVSVDGNKKTKKKPAKAK